MANEVILRTTWGRDPLPAGGDGQLAYLLVDLTVDAQAAGPAVATPLNLALVLDHSGSMGGPKLEHLKSAVQRVIEALRPDDVFSVTVFDEHAKVLVPAQPATDPAALYAPVAGLREAGGTQMSTGLRMGLDEARRFAGPDRISRILLLTDGQTGGDADTCVALATEAGRLGVPISAFGVGADEDWSVTLLDKIAQAGGGQADYIAQPADMLTSFRKTVQTMQETLVQHVTLTLQLATGLGVRAVYRITPMLSRLNPQADGAGTVTASLSDLGKDAPATVLFELTVPPRRPGQYRLGRAVARYALPGSPDAPGEVDQDVLASFAAGLPSAAGNPRVMNLVEKATAFRLQTRALEEAEIGNVTAASRNLRSAATRLLSLGEVDLANQATQEAERLDRQGQMSAAGTKKLTFATRKLAAEDLGSIAPGTPRPPAAPAEIATQHVSGPATPPPAMAPAHAEVGNPAAAPSPNGTTTDAPPPAGQPMSGT